MAEIKKQRLLPDRYPQREFFLCDVGDAVIKDDLGSMEHPIFQLSTKPTGVIKEYEHNGNIIQVHPSAKGCATIWDKDILIFAISQIMAAKNEGRPYQQEIVFTARDLLVYTNRMTNGEGYEGLKNALDRLDGTRIRTTIKTGGEEEWSAFGLIEKAHIKKKRHDGRVTEWGIKLSDWLFRAIEADQVLTIDPGYFRLRKSIDRRVYEISRKHTGEKNSWKVRLELLKKKTGSQDTLKKFRYNIRELSKSNILPTYTVSLSEDGEMVTFTRREQKLETLPPFPSQNLPLKDATRETAVLLLEGWDRQVVEQEWRSWVNDKGFEIQSPDAHFIKFCQTWVEKRGKAR